LVPISTLIIRVTGPLGGTGLGCSTGHDFRELLKTAIWPFLCCTSGDSVRRFSPIFPISGGSFFDLRNHIFLSFWGVFFGKIWGCGIGKLLGGGNRKYSSPDGGISLAHLPSFVSFESCKTKQGKVRRKILRYPPSQNAAKMVKG
jgi:hypothetical protein